MLDPRKITNPLTANEYLQDRILRHATFLEAYKTGEVQSIVAFLNTEVEADLIAQIRKYEDKTLTRVRLEALHKDVQTIVDAGIETLHDKLQEDLYGFALKEAGFHVKMLTDSLPMEVGLNTPSIATLKEIVTNEPINGAFVRDWMAKLSTDTSFRVNQQIKLGIAEGEGIQEMVRRIRGTRAEGYTDGILQVSRREAATIARTSVAGVSDNVRMETYRGNRDLVKGVRILTALDVRVCERCIALEAGGKVYPIDGAPHLPIHPGDRCSKVPALYSWSELGIDLKEAPEGTRSSSALTKEMRREWRKMSPEEKAELKRTLQGPVPQSLTYEAWLKQQSPAFIDDVLGKQKAQWFREGKLTAKDLVENGRILTLKELEARMRK